MKKLITISSLIFALSNITYAGAVLEENTAVVDMQQIITGSTAAKNLREAAEKKSIEYEKQAKKLEEELSKNNQDLSKKRSVLSEDAYAEKVREFENKIVEAQRNTQMKKIQLAQGFENGLAEISANISDIVEDLSKDRNYALVIPTTGLLYARPNLDITHEVLDKLNVKLPNLVLKLEPISEEAFKAEHKSKDHKPK